MSQFNDEENVYMKKYLALRNKCEHLQQGNEKLINRLQHVKKLISKQSREKKFLQARLDRYNDNYREAQVPVMWEEDQMYNLLKPKTEFPAENIVTTPTTSKPKTARKIRSILNSPDQSASNQLLASQSAESVMTTPKSVARIPGDSYSATMTSPDTPKRPTNAFTMFCDQYRQSVKNDYLREKNALIPQHELNKRLAMKWSSLSQEDKKTYQDMFDIQKRQHDREDLSTYEEAVSDLYLDTAAAVSSILTSQDLT
ncbi:hypothetical protein ACF0H5_013623 [Mactra antiquata]